MTRRSASSRIAAVSRCGKENPSPLMKNRRPPYRSCVFASSRSQPPREEAAAAAHLPNGPAAPADPLDEEHVVGIDVGADSAAGSGEAHHHIVEPRLRHEVEAAQQTLCGAAVQVDAVDQDGPVRVVYFYFLEGTMCGLPSSAAALHDAGFDVVAARESRK